MRIKSYTLLELLITTAIITICYCLAIPSLQRLLYLQNAMQTMNQLQTILNYARSLAILEQNKVKVCPSQDGVTCWQSWGDGLLLWSDKAKPYYFKLHVAATNSLSLAKSGFSNQKVEIQANGMTNSNGHFNFKSLKGNALPQFNLYFNRAFRIYVLRES